MLINKISKNIFIKILNIDHGFLVIQFPDNTKLTFGDKNSDIIGKLNIQKWGALNRIFRSGSIGFSEAYMEGEIFSENIAKVLYIMALNRNSNNKIMYGKKIYSYIN